MMKLSEFIKLPFAVQLLYLKVFILLPLCQCSVTFLHFKHLLKLYNLQPCYECQNISLNSDTYVVSVSSVIRRILSLPQLIRPRCLAQALTARVLLRQKGKVCILYFGAAMKEKSMVAHAWLKCGDLIVTGEEEKDSVTTIVTFC